MAQAKGLAALVAPVSKRSGDSTRNHRGDTLRSELRLMGESRVMLRRG